MDQTECGCRIKEGLAGAGGICRYENGFMIMAFSSPLGICSSNMAEARAIRIGLEWCIGNEWFYQHHY